ncbi:hypothetical protein [Paenibacillus xerothermodurans]|uniref:hypothetical protein n=1 Tax=Paenibacillus xerothermodurans TaxID=1977292 RepID=UPI001403618E|nr:hypothetical protein [Paenibacillus xerothermodurans]
MSMRAIELQFALRISTHQGTTVGMPKNKRNSEENDANQPAKRNDHLFKGRHIDLSL